MKIYLIRHGKTLANEQHLYCGSTDLPLSEQGVEELCKLKYHLSNVKFVTSGMCRTEQTLQCLFGRVEHRVDIRFREVDLGDFEMHSYAQLKDLPAYQQWISGDNRQNVPPRGESGAQMQKRVMEAFSQIREDTVVVTHGGCIAAIMERLFPDEGKNRYQWQPENGHGYVLWESGYRKIP